MNEQTKAQIDAKLALYKRQGLPVVTAQSLIQDEFGLQVQLNPTEPQAGHMPTANPDLYALTQAVVSGLEIYDSKREAIKLESQAVELQIARDNQIDMRFDTQEVLLRGLAGSHISHLSQHAALEAGEIDRLDPAASLRPFLEVMPKGQYDAAIAGLPASLRESLESGPALPAPKPVSDDRTVEVEAKPKRGFWGASR